MSTKKGKVLVTGGAGFIGSHQVDALIDAGFKVVVVDDLSAGHEYNVNSDATFYQMDIRDTKLVDVFDKERPDYVFHFAAQINLRRSVEDPVFDADVNVIGSLQLLDLCVEYGVKKVMFASTGGALYGEAEVVPTPETYPCRPGSPYGIAKYTIEQYLQFYSSYYELQYGIVRYSNVYGPRQNPKGEAGVISIFAERLLNHQEAVIHGDGHQTRDYVFVEDVIAANMLVFAQAEQGIYNVCTARQTTVNEVFDYMAANFEGSPRAIHKEAFYGQSVSCLSYQKIKNELNWEPEWSMEKGIEKTVEWFKNKKQ
jgi:UDP-glucose 4-epimerase